jgi:outer membrane protein OmpA-like peptidoglycan-associated protein
MSIFLRQSASLATAATLLVTAFGVHAQSGAQLKPASERISDQAIQADHRTYEAVQARIKALNDRGRPVRDYHLAKAQCWLDVSFHEYTRNDRSDFPQAALGEAEKLIVAMEQGATPGNDTPLVNGAARLRPDLWQRATGLRGHAGFRCVANKVACAEVELVHAGNEFNQQQWRHAKPYVQIAEDLIGEAQSGAEACLPPPAPPAPPVPVVVPPVVERLIEMTASVLFAFDKSDAASIRPVSRTQLDALARRIQADRLSVVSVKLVGHADRLNSTGQADYNQRLSEQRAATIRAELARLGIDASRISVAASGDTQQVQACSERFKSRAELEECLLPNRRVDVVVTVRQP